MRNVKWNAGRKIVLPLVALLACAALMQAARPASKKALRVVICGGGPTADYNQTAIESNVRYVGKLLPPDALLTTLFADGNSDKKTVQAADRPDLPMGEFLLELAFLHSDAAEDAGLRYRRPNLGVKLDGPDTPAALTAQFTALTQQSAAAPLPVFLYFTGHGGAGGDDFQNNVYSMWGDKTLSVRELARQMARLPENVPVTLVMAQCHSGGFADLIFEGGTVDGRPIARDFAGFFASAPDRMAAGCTAETDEAEYHDFTSYFFAALTGRDRVGRRVGGADYNGDGRVGMDEAFYYTLANDRSIDTPLCASDVFLRRYAPLSEKALDAVPYRNVRAWASAAQRYALDSLAKSLRRQQGEDRLKRAANDLDAGLPSTGAESRGELKRKFSEAQDEARRTLLARWPELRDPSLPDFALAKTQATAYLNANQKNAKWRGLLAADDALNQWEADSETREIAEAHLYRFVALGHRIVRQHSLIKTADAATKARFERLLRAEAAAWLLSAPSTGRFISY